jgi:hypothetical protein
MFIECTWCALQEKKVKCPLCDYVCANENPDLKVHIKRRHVPQTDTGDAVSAFKCHQCGIIASSKRDLKQHLKFHVKGPELKLFCSVSSHEDCLIFLQFLVARVVG